MKFKRAVPIDYQCVAIVQPGEYVIDRWDNQRCIEKSPHSVIKCDFCQRYFCLGSHWAKHFDEMEMEQVNVI